MLRALYLLFLARWWKPPAGIVAVSVRLPTGRPAGAPFRGPTYQRAGMLMEGEADIVVIEAEEIRRTSPRGVLATLNNAANLLLDREARLACPPEEPGSHLEILPAEWARKPLGKDSD